MRCCPRCCPREIAEHGNVVLPPNVHVRLAPMSERDELAVHAEVLRCDECGALSPDGRGGRAVLTVGPAEGVLTRRVA